MVNLLAASSYRKTLSFIFSCFWPTGECMSSTLLVMDLLSFQQLLRQTSGPLPAKFYTCWPSSPYLCCSATWSKAGNKQWTSRAFLLKKQQPTVSLWECGVLFLHVLHTAFNNASGLLSSCSAAALEMARSVSSCRCLESLVGDGCSMYSGSCWGTAGWQRQH